MKYRCTLEYFDEDIIEADSPEEAESIFWENNEVNIEDYLYIKQFRKKTKKKRGEMKQEFHPCEMEHIPMSKWGKDHWSTLVYLETLAVDGRGLARPANARMRTNEKRHPHLLGNTGFSSDALNGSGYPTRLKEGEVQGHDDWDCVDDATEEGLTEDVGTGLNRAYKFTKLGKEVMAKLRQFKMDGGNFGDFVFEKTKVSPSQKTGEENANN